MEIIGAILYIAWIVIKYAAIGAFYAAKFTIKYLSPIILCVVMFFIGGSCGSSCMGGKYDEWRREQIKEYTHQIVICWDETGSDTTTITVREDLDWCINGCENAYNVFDKGDNSSLTPDVPDNRETKDGKAFAGLYTSAGGGTKVVNAKGYSVISVKDLLKYYGKDKIMLYAVWE